MALRDWLGGLRQGQIRGQALRGRRGPSGPPIAAMVQTLETRTMLDGANEAPQVDYLYLVNDTGLWGDDVTSDPRITGSFYDPDSSGGSYVVELDVNGDSQADQSLTVSPYSSFEFNPSSLLTIGQSVTARVRVTETLDTGEGSVTTAGTWSTLSFLYSAATDAGAAPQMDYLYLVNDTGTWGDSITSDPRITGTFYDPDSTGGSYSAELDLNGDGTADQTVNVTSGSSFEFNPTSLLTPDHVVNARVRGREILTSSLGTSNVVGAWASMTFTYSAQSDAGEAPQIDYLYLVNDTGTWGDSVTSDAQITGSLYDSDSTGGTYAAELDLTGDGVAELTTSSIAGGQFTFSPASFLTPGQTVTARVRGRETLTSGVGTSIVYGAWATLTYTYSATGDAGQAPQVDYLYLVNDTGEYGDAVTTDARITGTLYDPDSTGGVYTAELDLNGDNVIDQSIAVGGSGQFEFNPASLLTTGQQVTARVRGRETLTNSVGTSSLTGGWSTLQFTYQGEGGGPTNPPPTNILGLRFTEDVPSGSVVSGRFGVLAGTIDKAAHALTKISEQTTVDGSTTTFTAIYHRVDLGSSGTDWTYTRSTTDGEVTDEHWTGWASPGWFWDTLLPPVLTTFTPDESGVFRSGYGVAHLYVVNNNTAVLIEPVLDRTAGPEAYVAIIDWGDGTTSLGQVDYDWSGQSYSVPAYVVQGEHTYTDVGEYDITVQAFGPEFWSASGPFNYGETWTDEINATVVPQTLTATFQSPQPILGESFTEAVATFTDSGSTVSASSYQARILWGDSGWTNGTVVADGQGGYRVLGTHTYYDTGSKALEVRILRTNGAEVLTSGTVSVAAAAPLTLTAEVTSDAVPLGRFAVYEGEWNNGFAARTLVRDSTQTQVTGTTSTYTAVYRYAQLGPNAPTWTYERITTNGTVTAETWTGMAIPSWWGLPEWAPPQLTTFERDNTGVFRSGMSEAHLQIVNDSLAVLFEPTGSQWTNPSDYVSVVDWGDGTTSLAEVGYDTGLPDLSLMTFGVRGEHTYATPGQYAITVQTFGPQLLSLDGAANHGESWTAQVAATVVPQSLSATIADVQPVVGQAFSGTVATFTDSASGGTAASYTAMITWGDGSLSAGSIVADGANSYHVVGTHTYSAAGNLPLAVRVQRLQGARLTVSDTIHVLSVPPIFVVPGTPLTDIAVTRIPYSSLNWVNTASAAATGQGMNEYGTEVITYELQPGIEAQYTRYWTGSEIWSWITVSGWDDTAQEWWSANLTDPDNDGVFVAVDYSMAARMEASREILRWVRTGDLTAVINWGDGTTNSGTIQPAWNQVSVTGSHTYTASGSFEVTTTVTGPGGTLWTETLPATARQVAVDDAYTGLHDRIWTIASAQGILANDTSRPSGSLPVLSQGPSHGTLVLNNNGSFSYTPSAHFVGTDEFTYRLAIAPGVYDEATVTLTVTNTNPIATAETYRIRPGQTLVADGVGSRPAGVLANDTDADGDLLQALLITNPAHGVLTFHSDGTFSYTPATGYLGADSFTYQITDGAAVIDPRTVTLNVENQAPVATNDTYSLAHGRTLVADGAGGHPVGVLGNDTDADLDTLSVTLVAGPTSGTLVLNPTGSFTYTPGTMFVGTDQFQYSVSDGFGGAATSTVTIAVTNQTPVAHDDQFMLIHDRSLVFDPRANDTDADADSLSITITTPPTHGTLVALADGRLRYQPAQGYVGPDEFSYSLSDGLTISGLATVNLTITNQALTAQADQYVLSHDRTLITSADSGATHGVLSNDNDPDQDILTVTLESGVSHGTLTLLPNGNFVYKPAAGYVRTDSFSYTVTDGIVTSASILVSLSVVNALPVVVSGDIIAMSGHPTTIANSQIATDADGDPLTIQIVSAPAVGTLAILPAGGLNYSSPIGSTGLVTFTYTVSDGLTTSAPITGTLNIQPPRPVAVSDAFTTPHSRSLRMNVVANDYHPDNNRLAPMLASLPSHGTVAVNDDGTITYTPNRAFAGIDSFTYFARDLNYTQGILGSETTTVTIDVTNDTLSQSPAVKRHVQAGAVLLFDVRDFYPQFDSDALQLSIETPPDQGEADIVDDETLRYTAPVISDPLRSTSIVVRVSDGASSTLVRVDLSIWALAAPLQPNLGHNGPFPTADWISQVHYGHPAMPAPPNLPSITDAIASVYSLSQYGYYYISNSFNGNSEVDDYYWHFNAHNIYRDLPAQHTAIERVGSFSSGWWPSRDTWSAVDIAPEGDIAFITDPDDLPLTVTSSGTTTAVPIARIRNTHPLATDPAQSVSVKYGPRTLDNVRLLRGNTDDELIVVADVPGYNEVFTSGLRVEYVYNGRTLGASRAVEIPQAYQGITYTPLEGYVGSEYEILGEITTPVSIHTENYQPQVYAQGYWERGRTPAGVTTKLILNGDNTALVVHDLNTGDYRTLLRVGVAAPGSGSPIATGPLQILETRRTPYEYYGNMGYPVVDNSRGALFYFPTALPPGPYSLNIDWGDGAQSTMTVHVGKDWGRSTPQQVVYESSLPASAIGFSVSSGSHAYTQSGVYTITGTLNGQTSSTEVLIGYMTGANDLVASPPIKTMELATHDAWSASRRDGEIVLGTIPGGTDGAGSDLSADDLVRMASVRVEMLLRKAMPSTPSYPLEPGPYDNTTITLPAFLRKSELGEVEIVAKISKNLELGPGDYSTRVSAWIDSRQLDGVSYDSQVVVTHVVDVGRWSTSAKGLADRDDDSRVDVGAADVSLQTGSIRSTIPFDISQNRTDPRLSPLTLMFDSASTHVRPVVSAMIDSPKIASVGGSTKLKKISGTLKWADREESEETAIVLPNDQGLEPVAFGIQLQQPVRETGIYKWTMRLRLTVEVAGHEIVVSEVISGESTVVVNDAYTRSTNPQDPTDVESEEFDAAAPFGAGWSLNGLDRLAIAEDESLLWIRGDGSVRRYRPASLRSAMQWYQDPYVGSFSSQQSWLLVPNPSMTYFLDGTTRPTGDKSTWPVDGSRIEYDGPAKKFTLKLSTGEEYEFDEDGFLNEIRYSDGQKTQYFYNDGRLDRVVAFDGSVTQFNYDGSGHLEQIVQPGGRNIDFTVNGAGQLTEVRYRDNVFGDAVRQFDYNAHNDLVSDDRAGLGTRYVYDENDTETVQRVEIGASAYQIQSVWERLVKLQSIDDHGQYRASIEAPRAVPGAPATPGPVTDYVLNGDGQILETIRPDRLDGEDPSSPRVKETFEYRDGRLLRSTSAAGIVTTYDYDFRNDPALRNPWLRQATTSAFGGITPSFQYDARGHITASQDARDTPITIEYVLRNGKPTDLVRRKRYADGSSEEWSYNAAGLPDAYIDRGGLLTNYSYDQHRRVIQQTSIDPADSSLTRSLTFDYDVAGNLWKITDPLGNVTTRTYDALNRLRLETVNDAQFGLVRSAGYVYDASGLLTEVNEGGERRTHYDYNSAGQVWRKIEGYGTSSAAATVYEYYQNGDLERITYSDGHHTRYFYDPMTRESWEVTDGIAGVDGQLDQVQTVHTQRDVSGNVTLVENLLTGEKTENEYTLEGWLRKSTETVNLGEGPVQTVTRYNHDQNGNLIQVRPATGAALAYDYDALNQKIGERVLDPHGRQTIYQYDASGNVIAELEYGLRGIDPQTGAEIFAVHTTTSQYDAFGQLRAVHDAADGHSYSNFDAAGHLTSTADRDGRITSYVYDAVGQLRRQTDAAGNITRYDYDLAGRQTDVIVESAAPEGDPAFVYRHQRLEFDPLNRVTKVEHFDRILGQLVLQATETTNYVYQNGLSVETATDQYNSVTMTTSDGLGHLVRVIRSNPDGDAPQTNFGYSYDAGAAMLTTTRTERLDATRWVSTQVVTNTLGGVLVNRDANNRVVASTFYDAAGHPTSVYEDGRGWTETVYDSATGQPSQIQQGNVSNGVSNAVPTEIQYDSNGNRLYLKDRLGNETWWDYDELGRVTQETTQLDVVDSQGLPTGALQSVLRTWTYHGTIAGLGTVTDYQDRDGRIIRSIVSPDGQTLTERWYEPGADLNGSQTYVREIVTRRNAAGEILSAASQGSSGPMSTVSLAYDALGRPQFETQGIGDLEATIDTAWDDTARTTSRTFTLNPWGTDQIAQQLTYQRNALGQVVQVAQNFASGNSDLWANGSVGQAKRIDLAYMANGARDTLHRYRVTSGGTSERGWTKSNYAANGRLGLLEHYTTAGVAAAFANYTNQYKPTGQLESQKTVLDDGVSGGDPLYNKSTWFDYWADGQFRRIGTQDGSNPVAWEPDRIYDVNGNQNGGRIIGKGNRLLEDPQYRYRYDHEGHLLSKTAKLNAILDNDANPSVFSPDSSWYGIPAGYGGTQIASTESDPALFISTPTLAPGDYELFATWAAQPGGARGSYSVDGATGALSDIEFSQNPVGVRDANNVSWQSLGRIHVSTTGSVTIALRRAVGVAGAYGALLADAFRVLPAGQAAQEYEWDHRGRLTSVTTSHFGDFITQRTAYAYDALNRRISRAATIYSSPTDTGTQHTTHFIFDGEREGFELDQYGLITRANLNGLDSGEVWAVDDTLASTTTTVWQFADPQGTVRTVGRVNGDDQWIIQQRMFDADGELVDRLGVTNDTVLTALPAIWNGERQDVATGLYGTGSRVYDASAGRFINQASAATDSNPYRYDNGDPVNGSPFTSFGAFGYGVWDAILFGRFDDIVPGASGADAYAHQNGWYYGGMAVGVAGSIWLGNWAGATVAVGRVGSLAYVGARTYQAYSIAGDVVGIHDSYQGMRNGDFGPLNLLGFAPTIGWASKGFGGIRALGSFPEVGKFAQELWHDIRFAPRRGMIDLSAYGEGYDRIFGGKLNDKGVSLSLRMPSILSLDSLPDAERGLLHKHYGVKKRALQNAAARGMLTWTPNTDAIRISALQESYRTRVAERFQSMFGHPLDMNRLNADHGIDLIVGGSPYQRLRMIHESINKSIGASLLRAGQKANLTPGQRIYSIYFMES